MKKTVNVNIGGMVFHLDDDAYDKCSAYLDTLKTKFKSVEGGDEIISDIELRVAELFKERMDGMREVVNLEDVKYMISVMGDAETIVDDELVNESSDENEKDATAGPRRLYRDPDHRVIGGVCGGFGAYLGIDPIIIRIILICLFIFAGTGVLLYIILWIAMPVAVTASDKLMMRGKSVNINSIEKTVKSEWKDTKSSLKNVGEKARSSKVLHGIGRTISVIIGMGFILFSALILVGFVWAMVSNKAAIHDVHSNGQELHLSLQQGASMIFDSFGEMLVAYIAAWLLVVVPCVMAIFMGIRLILGLKRQKYVFLTGFILIVIGIILASYSGITLVEKFKSEARTEESTPVWVSDSTMIDLSVISSDNIPGYNLDGFPIFSVNFDIVKTMTDSLPSITIEKEARGSSRSKAMDNASDINFYSSISGNKIQLAPYFMLDKNTKYRGQTIDVNLKLPVGYRVYLNEDMDMILDDVKNIQDVWDGDMPNHTWLMTPTGLMCEDCPDDIIRSGKHKDEEKDGDTDITIHIDDEDHHIEIN